ncbi:mRNA surveillance protein pelota [Methanobrevibacter sp.]|uniref:mRNA surveillance protein pelota n=1 Tax=Methanobrevibacter sp. TaxID=66852 RepID=UPI0026DF9406|nr:mRNA surveillance protein pelota [Methanobrevibacter sp.]MDO5860023.1 mRNA surveillance protein pelota [Methanobrevibacter sp.]
MRIINQDTKEGIIEVVPETLDDLWHLSHIVEVGDNASSKTTRRIQDNTGDKLRSDRGVKKTFYLGLDIENISFHIFTGKLRLTGVITRGPEDLIPLGSHHTLEVKLNTPITIKKERWPKWAIKRINQAIDASKKLSAMIVVLEDDSATLGLMRQFGIEYYGPIKGSVSGKRILDKNRQKNIVQFYEKVIESIEKFDSIENIVIAGPGFVKNDFYDYIKEKHKDLAKKSIIESTGSGGRVGISEVLKKGTVEKLTSENRVAIEMGAIEKLLTQIGKNSSKIVYGLKETKNAINLGAVSELLVLDTKVASENMGDLMDMVENMKGEVMVISSEHDGGKQLESLGGMAAILRYEIY